MCFYCNRTNTDKVYSSVKGGRIELHSKCVAPMKTLIREEIYERR